MAYVTRVPGTVIAAASQNSEYRDQVVSVFATTAARDAAITVPVRGMMCYCTVPGRMFVRGASAWYEAGVADGAAQVRRYRARRVAAQTIAVTAGTVAISWDTEDDDPDGMAAVPFTTFTLTDGLWIIGGVVDLILTMGVAAPGAVTQVPYVSVDHSVLGVLSRAQMAMPPGTGFTLLAASTSYTFRVPISAVVPAVGGTLSVNVQVPIALTNTPTLTAQGTLILTKAA